MNGGIEKLLSAQEYEFVKQIFLNPNCKNHDCFYVYEDENGEGQSVSLWHTPEALGLIRCTGSYRWEPVGLHMSLSRTVTTPPQPVTRPLSSLTETEAREAFAKAGLGNDGEIIDRYDAAEQIIITDNNCDLLIRPNGFVSARQLGSRDGLAHEFNAARLIRYLDSIGIALGAE